MKRPNIIIVGSLNMDLIVLMRHRPRIGETVQANSLHYIPGGKGANQAVGCSRLGANVTMIGAVGGDPFGDRLIDAMRHEGVATDQIARLDGVSTGTAAIFHTQEDNCIAVVPGANAHISVDRVAACEEVIARADLLLVQLEIPQESVHKALDIARSFGITTILNPAPAKNLPEGLLRLADFLTPNETEFETLCGSKPTSNDILVRSIHEWEKKFGNKLVVTRGAAGSCYLDADRLVPIPAPRVEAVDTTGAGDAFNAALSFGMASGWTLESAVSFACKAASISVTRFGAQGGMPTWNEVMNS